MKANLRNLVAVVSFGALAAFVVSPIAGCIGIVGDFPVSDDGTSNGADGGDAGRDAMTNTGTPDSHVEGGGTPETGPGGPETGTHMPDAGDAGFDAPPTCNSTQLLCGGACVPIDTTNCGACGTRCSGGTPDCARGDAGAYGCVSGCPSATPTLCGSTCTDTASDPSNCQTCGHVCTTTVTGAAGTCTNGSCGFACPANDTYCSASNACVDTTSDNNNCKTCGTVCPSPSTCQNSTCTCPSPDTLCGNACTNVANDPNNCGTCANQCATNETCVNRSCECVSPYVTCNGKCIDPNSDANNCGSCGYACGIGNCQQGICLPATITVAGSTYGAVDGKGNLFTLDQNAGILYGGAVTASALVQYASGFKSPDGLVTLPGVSLVYVADTGNNHIDAYNTSSGALDFVMNANNGSTTTPVSIGSDGSNVYWTLGNGYAELMKAPGGQNAPTALYRAVGGDNTGMAYDSTTASLFMGGLVGSTNGIIKCPVAGTACALLTSPPSTVGVEGMATTAGTLYYTLYDATGNGNGGLFSCPTSACTTPTALATGATWSGAGRLTIDTTYNYIYFLSSVVSNGETGLYRCPLSGCGSAGPQTVIPAGYLFAGNWLTNDSTALYWGNGGTNVSRLLKHP
jgi:hypothetical protein